MRTRSLTGRDLAVLAGFVVLACAAYGAVLSGWRSPRLAAYGAVKLPVLFLATMVVVSGSNWMLAVLAGAGLSFRDMLFLVFGAMAASGWVLLALVPVVLFLQRTGIPVDGSPEYLRYAHNAMLMTHIVVLALAGLSGNTVLFEGLRRGVKPGCGVHRLFMAWIACFAFVGCQMGWMMRPFVGSPFYPVVFLRENALERNFYEFVFGEVVPFLLGVRT